MSQPTDRIIEFFGGPVDGCAENFTVPLERLVMVHSAGAVPRNGLLRRIVRMLLLRDPWETAAVYFYQLTEHDCDLGYLFVGFGTAAHCRSKIGVVTVENDATHLRLTAVQNRPPWSISSQD